jgi:PKD repeat protein
MKIILSAVFLFFATVTLAQKHDYMWPLGFGPNKSEYRFFCDFKSDTPIITLRQDTFSTGLFTAAYSDKNGQILFFSNGQRLFDKYGAIVENGEDLNPTIVEWNSQHQNSYPGGQSGFFLENPDDQNTIFFISLDWGAHPAQEWPYRYVGQNLVVATIDISANNGSGKVLEKNKVLLTGTLMSPTACRHANGRDWWILVSDADENRHYRILLTPEGFSAASTQFIGTKPNPIPYDGENKFNQVFGNCFSPQGSYYADINDNIGFSIFEFDRCTGLLSNERRIDYPPPPAPPSPGVKFYKNGSGSGAVFSPNEKFFYKTTTFWVSSVSWGTYGTKPYLLQYDLTDANLNSSVDTINTIDSSDYHFPSNITWGKFLGAENAPDGRIYVVHEGNSYCTVQYPNLGGKDCKFVHDKPSFGVAIGIAIPYMPNYRLGPLDGSSCDSLGMNNIPVANFRLDDTLGPFARYFYDLSHHEPAEWYWSFGDGHTSTEQNPLHEYDSAGVFQACLTVSNQYGSDTYCKTLYLGVSSTDNPVQESLVVVSPNPFQENIQITVPPQHSAHHFMLFNALGILVLQKDFKESFQIETHTLPPGIYHWMVAHESWVVSRGSCIKGR